MTACPRLRAPWETFLDGELPAAQMLELQSHLDGCAECSEDVAFSRAVRNGTRQVVRSEQAGDVSEAFRERLRAALEREAVIERHAQSVARAKRLMRQWAPRAGALAVSSAAAAVLWVRMHDNVEPTTDMGGRVSMSGRVSGVAPARNDSAAAAQSAVLEPEELLDRL